MHSQLFAALRSSLVRWPLAVRTPAGLALRAHSTAAAPAALLLTPSAQSRLAALRARARAEGRADADSLVLRVKVDSGGCSGFKYEFLVESGGGSEGDVRVGGGEGCAVVDEVSMGFLRGATLDYEETLMRSAFTIAANPNAEASCGCKMSFAAKPAASEG